MLAALTAALSETGVGSSLVCIVTLTDVKDVASSLEVSLM